MDAFACLEGSLVAWPAYRSAGNGLQMHFNTRLLHIEKRHMQPLPQVKISTQLVVDIEQHVFVERSCHAGCVVIGGFEYCGVFDQVNAQQQAAGIALN